MKSVTDRRFGDMERRASPCNDAMRKRLVKAMLIAEDLEEPEIVEGKVRYTLSNGS